MEERDVMVEDKIADIKPEHDALGLPVFETIGAVQSAYESAIGTI